MISEQAEKKLQVTYKGKVVVLEDIPSSFKEFHSKITEIYEESLPEDRKLIYIHSEKGSIHVSSDEEYISMLEFLKTSENEFQVIVAEADKIEKKSKKHRGKGHHKKGQKEHKKPERPEKAEESTKMEIEGQEPIKPELSLKDQAKKIAKDLYLKEHTREELAALENSLQMIKAQMTEEDKIYLDRLIENIIAHNPRAQFIRFFMTNIDKLAEVVGRRFEKKKKELDELIPKLVSSFESLPEEKQDEIDLLLKGALKNIQKQFHLEQSQVSM